MSSDANGVVNTESDVTYEGACIAGPLHRHQNLEAKMTIEKAQAIIAAAEKASHLSETMANQWYLAMAYLATTNLPISREA